MINVRLLLGTAAGMAVIGCQPFMMASAATPSSGPDTFVGTRPGNAGMGTPLEPAEGNQLAAFSAGCFWGVEDVFRHVPGVVATAVGYTGGHTKNPTYRSVCSHTTGHAETVLVEFDPKKTSYRKLLAAFWANHDPTTLNRQGPDFGDQYRSAIWVFSQDQYDQAMASGKAEQRNWRSPIVTEVKEIGPFYMAEDYHQQYHEKTGTAACPTGRG